MTETQWHALCDFRTDFKAKCAEWDETYSPLLRPLLQKITAENDSTPYPIENPVVYNTALDDITADSDIKVIVIGDNPGKNEQSNAFKKYLVGQSGKIAQSFFEKNREFALDFRKNTIILNKTPIHTAKTVHLKLLAKADPRIFSAIRETQMYMAQKTAELHIKMARESAVELWLVGYAEIKKHGVFELYRESLKNAYENAPRSWENVFAFQHFSMNRFTIDLKAHTPSDTPLVTALKNLGRAHKRELF